MLLSQAQYFYTLDRRDQDWHNYDSNHRAYSYGDLIFSFSERHEVHLDLN